MRGPKALTDLLDLLARLYAAEGRPGGDEAASALRAVLADFPPSLPDPYNYLPGAAEAALALDPHPEAAVVAAALPLIRWFHVVDSMRSIDAEMGGRMLVCELVGPNGMVFQDRVRIGLFVQCANLDYPTRRHDAEETYIILGGEGYWGKGDEGLALRRAGDVVFHASNVPHRSATAEKPTIAAWRWSGDIRYEKYACTG